MVFVVRLHRVETVLLLVLDGSKKDTRTSVVSVPVDAGWTVVRQIGVDRAFLPIVVQFGKGVLVAYQLVAVALPEDVLVTAQDRVSRRRRVARHETVTVMSPSVPQFMERVLCQCGDDRRLAATESTKRRTGFGTGDSPRSVTEESDVESLFAIRPGGATPALQRLQPFQPAQSTQVNVAGGLVPGIARGRFVHRRVA